MCSHWLYSTFWASWRRKSYFYDILLSTSVGVENICVFFLCGDISGDAGIMQLVLKAYMMVMVLVKEVLMVNVS